MQNWIASNATSHGKADSRVSWTIRTSHVRATCADLDVLGVQRSTFTAVSTHALQLLASHERLTASLARYGQRRFALVKAINVASMMVHFKSFEDSVVDQQWSWL